MALTWGQVAYYTIVCVTTTMHFEADQVFFVTGKQERKNKWFLM